jgi:polyhydroxybutyrate depolymerase
MRARRVGGLLGIVLVAAGSGFLYLGYSSPPEAPRLSASVRAEELQVGNRTRSYLSYVPDKLEDDSPLVIALHGSNETPQGLRKVTAYELEELADARRFALVYPRGYRGNWNDCRRQAPYPAHVENVDDVGFMKALVARMHERHATSTTRIFAFGYSNGGQMAFRLAIEEPQLVSAIAAAGSLLPRSDNMGCAGEGPTARVMLVNGTKDPISPFEGGEVTLFGFASRGYAVSADQTAESFAQRNGLKTSGPRRILPHAAAEDPTSVDFRAWSADSQGRPQVVQYVVHDGGHVVPQRRYRFPRLFGRTTGDLDMPAEAVAFFLGPPAP